jgi:hypothetical protein
MLAETTSVALLAVKKMFDGKSQNNEAATITKANLANLRKSA